MFDGCVLVSLRTPSCIQYKTSYLACNLYATSRTSLATDGHALMWIRILGQCNALPYLNQAASRGQVLFYVSWWYCINLAAPFSEITLFVSYTTKLPATFLLMFIDSADNVHRYLTWFLFSILIFDPEGTLLYLYYQIHYKKTSEKSGPPVITARRVLRLRKEKVACRFGGWR